MYKDTPKQLKRGITASQMGKITGRCETDTKWEKDQIAAPLYPFMKGIERGDVQYSRNRI